MSAAGLVVAAPASGSGKTTITLALLRALRARGLHLGSFKVGPDYIDPAFHRAASGGSCPNLDSWAMRLETLAGLAGRAARGVDLVVGEGAMGLFDGAADGSGSTADIATLLGLPVVLVVDAHGMGASAAALIEGFIHHRTELDIAAVIFNRVGSPRHLRLLARACDDRFSQPVLGGLPRDPGLVLPSRHLGLVQAGEHLELEAFFQRAAERIAAHVDLDRLIRLARPLGLDVFGPPPCPLPPLGQRIALARDHAFAFAYPAVIDGWRAAGAEVVPFSPLADEAPDAHADAVYLPGGYPELHAAQLATSRRFLDGLRDRADAGAAVYGECGGYMVLGETLVDSSGHGHEMAGLLPLVTSFAERRLHLGYRRVTLIEDGPLGRAGAGFRAHEFHYAGETARGAAPSLFEAADGQGQELGAVGCRCGNVAGSFVHLIDHAEPERVGQRSAQNVR